MTEEDQSAALLAAALSAHGYGATEVASILFRTLLERYPLSTEAAAAAIALVHLRSGREVRDVVEPHTSPRPGNGGA
jgi:hypothetical protein